MRGFESRLPSEAGLQLKYGHDYAHMTCATWRNPRAMPLEVSVNTHQRRKPTNLSIDASLVAEARELDVNLSRAAEDGIRQQVRQARADQWQRENRAALVSSNAYVETHGTPLGRYRQF